MPIPTINLIPPAFYLRKKVRTAVVIAVAALIAETAALVAFAMSESARHTDLQGQQTEWQAKSDAVDKVNQQAAAVAAGVADLTGKTTFIHKVFDSNGQWPAVFENIRDYTYPRVTYKSIKPTAGTSTVTMDIDVPDTKAVRAQRALNLYWANLLRDPALKTAVPNQNLGYVSTAVQNGGGGAPGAGPSGVPGGPGVPAPPGGRYIGSPTSLTSGIQQGANSEFQQADLNGAPGGAPPGGAPPGGATAVNPADIAAAAPPPTFPFTITADLKTPITVPTFGAAQPAQ